MEPTAQTDGYWPAEEQAPARGWWKASDGSWYPPTSAPAAWVPPTPSGYLYGSGYPQGGAPFDPQSPPPQSWVPMWSEPAPTGNGFSITAIVLGCIAFLFIPPLFGVMGLIFGGVGLSRKEKLAPVGMIVSGLGLILGFIIGAIVVTVLHR